MEPNNELPPVERSKIPKEQSVGSENLPPAAEVFGNATAYSMPQTNNQSAAQPAGPIQAAGGNQPIQPTSTPVIDDAMIADETDLIEKEWVDKAKAIVAHTQNDPHLQNKEMSKVKAQYLKKRYNKDLKLSDE